MKLFKISQSENENYDTFDSLVVAAETEDDARNIHPYGEWEQGAYPVWCKSPDQVTVEYIGEAAPHILKGVVIGSFNAG